MDIGAPALHSTTAMLKTGLGFADRSLRPCVLGGVPRKYVHMTLKTDAMVSGLFIVDTVRCTKCSSNDRRRSSKKQQP